MTIARDHVCDVPGCKMPAPRSSLCAMHRRRVSRRGDPGGPLPLTGRRAMWHCCVPGCTTITAAPSGMCRPHRQRVREKGYPCPRVGTFLSPHGVPPERRRPFGSCDRLPASRPHRLALAWARMVAILALFAFLVGLYGEAATHGAPAWLRIALLVFAFWAAQLYPRRGQRK